MHLAAKVLQKKKILSRENKANMPSNEKFFSELSENLEAQYNFMVKTSE